MGFLRNFLFLLSLILFNIFPFTYATPLEKRALALSGSPAVVGRGTYPRATTLRDGSLLACFTAFSNGNNVLTTAKSTNKGATWSVIGSVATAATAQRDLDNCFVHQLPSGRVLAAFRNHDRTSASGPWTFYRITVCASDDNGVSWTFLSEPRTSGTPGLGLWEPFMMDALDGSLMLYFSRETNTNGSDQDSILIRSTDGGLTWSGDQTISGGSLTARDGMVGVARMGAGSRNLIAVFESLAPDTGVHSVTSSDDGATWGNRRVVYKSPVSGAVNAAPQITYIGGTLVVSWQTQEDNTSLPEAVKVIASHDGGATWGEKIVVRGSCLWAGQLALDSSSTLVLCAAGDGNSYAQKVTI